MPHNMPDNYAEPQDFYFISELCYQCEKPITEDEPALEVGTRLYCADCFNSL